MTVTPADIPRVAATIRLAGELLEVHGHLMLQLTNDWTTGPNAANLDPDTGGNQWETDEHGDVWAIPTDPTGEAAITANRTDLANQLQTRLTRIIDDAQWLRDTAHVLAPIVPPSTMNERNDLWCTHHLRIGLCEVRHRGEDCRYCYDFLTLWKIRPPITILRDRQAGKRITEQAVKDAIAADGAILQTVGGVTKALRQARPTKRNQNQKRKTG